MNDLGAIGTERKEDTLKAQGDAGWSLMTDSEGWVLDEGRERKKAAEEEMLGLEGVFWPGKV